MNKNIIKQLPTDSPLIKKPFGGLTSNMLRVLATVFMLSDHLWASVVPGNRWMTDLGRLAFPIYAFMITEGFIHTSNAKKYLKRLLIFAVISEVPFDLFYSSEIVDPFNQNVLFTFVWGLLAIMQIDKIKKYRELLKESENKKSVKKSIAVSCLLIVLISFGAKLTFTDYKFLGYLTVVMFYVVRDFPFAWALQLVGMVLLNWTFFEGEIVFIELFGKALEIPNQAYAVFALIPIWLYGGKKGKKLGKITQYGFYVFYPLHMLILYLIQQIISSMA